VETAERCPHDASGSLYSLIRALAAVLRHEALPVGVRGKVRSVDGDALAHAGVRLAQPVQHGDDAGVQQRLVGAQLRREAVARPLAWRGVLAAQRGPQRGVLSDKPCGARPRRDRVHALSQRHADHCADRVARSAGPAGRLKLADQPRNLRRVEQSCKLECRRARCYLWEVHGASLCGPDPRRFQPSRGSSFAIRMPNCTGSIGRNKCMGDCMAGRRFAA
jgi:hypothetical protein